MEAKSTLVTLVSDAGVTRDFETDHAARLLGMPLGSGWSLPEGSTFNFDLKNGITVKPRPDKGTATEKRAGGGN